MLLLSTSLDERNRLFRKTSTVFCGATFKRQPCTFYIAKFQSFKPGRGMTLFGVSRCFAIYADSHRINLPREILVGNSAKSCSRRRSGAGKAYGVSPIDNSGAEVSAIIACRCVCRGAIAHRVMKTLHICQERNGLTSTAAIRYGTRHAAEQWRLVYSWQTVSSAGSLSSDCLFPWTCVLWG